MSPAIEPSTGRMPVPLAQKISAEDTARVIRAFYDTLRVDPELGHFFAHIEDFSAHEKLIIAFWRTAMGDRGAEPAPVDMLGKHLPLSLNSAHFERWLQVFGQTLSGELPPELADQWLKMAQGIAATLARRSGVSAAI